MRYGLGGRIAAAARALALSSLFVGAHVAPSWAWGDLGHKIICEIALSRVKPATRSEIDKLMQTDTEFSSFSDACVWPDHPRKRASEHFLNLPRNSHGLTENDCGGANACVVTAIAKDAAVLSASSSTTAEKLASLKYLGHWIGDVHQPLHVSFEDDRGGNNIKVSGMCSGNLHSVWDTCLVTNAVGSDAVAAAGRLERAITDADVNAWSGSTPMEWANESFAITEGAKTEYCAESQGSCEPTSKSVKIDEAYIAANAPLVRMQLEKAGVRLAEMLDDTIGRQ